MLVVVLDVRPKDCSWLTWFIFFRLTGKDVLKMFLFFCPCEILILSDELSWLNQAGSQFLSTGKR